MQIVRMPQARKQIVRMPMPASGRTPTEHMSSLMADQTSWCLPAVADRKWQPMMTLTTRMPRMGHLASKNIANPRSTSFCRDRTSSSFLACELQQGQPKNPNGTTNCQSHTIAIPKLQIGAYIQTKGKSSLRIKHPV